MKLTKQLEKEILKVYDAYWQGYMNGAVESGRRAAAEVEATHV